jgi:hypothetical protein
MTRSKLAPVVGMLALVVFAAPSAAQEKLRYKYKVGDKRDYTLEQKTMTKTNIKGMDMEGKVEMSMEMSWEAKKIDDKGNAHMELKFGRVKMEIHSPAGIFEFDSADDKEPKDAVGKMLQPVIRALASTQVDVVQGPRGNVLSVEIPEAILKKLRAVGGGMTAFDDTTVRAMAQGGIVFPEEPVAVGKTWNDTQKVDLPFGKVTSELKYTLDGQEDRDGGKVSKISFTAKTKIDTDDKADVKVVVKDAAGKGTAQFDHQAGVLLEQTMDLTMQMDIETMGLMLTQNMVQNTTIRLRPKK